MVANDYDDQFVGWVVDRDTFSRDFYISHCLLLNHSLSSSLSLTSIFWLYERDISVYINHINHQISHPFFDLGDLCICNQLLCSVASTAETTVNQAEIERKRPWPILRIRSGKRGLGLGGAVVNTTTTTTIIKVSLSQCLTDAPLRGIHCLIKHYAMKTSWEDG